MKEIRHDNIVQFYDTIASPNNYYIIQERCESTLADFLKHQPGNRVIEATAHRMLT